ncbi:MAG TPA: hypothetical protein VLF69_05885 [Candidatus Saccharimonadales bacterium]|nr:hypothetical protein [Candidatus Saccharimonadales bacterium]
MRRLLYGLLLVLLLAISGPLATVSAAPAGQICNVTSNPLACACTTGNGSSDSTACSAGTGDPISGSNGILKKASLVIATLAGIAAVIIIIVGGFQFVTSNGDANKAAGARKAVIGATVGLVIIAVAEGAVILIVSKL